jgi:hypothetical protein
VWDYGTDFAWRVKKQVGDLIVVEFIIPHFTWGGEIIEKIIDPFYHIKIHHILI